MRRELITANERGVTIKLDQLIALSAEADQQLEPLEELEFNLRHRMVDETYIATAREQLAAAERVWATVGRPATVGEIAFEIGNLFACYPNIPKSTLEHVAGVMAEDVLSCQPSLYALVRTCRAVRRKHRFPPTIAEVLDEMKRAKRRHVDYAILIERNLSVELDEAEQLLPCWRAEQEQADAQRLADLRERSNEFPPEQFPGLYNNDELNLLGLDRDAVETAFIENLEALSEKQNDRP